MKFLFSSLLLILLFLPREGYSQSHKWVRGGGSTTSLSTLPMREAVYSMCTDRNGNIYSLSIMGGTSIVADTFYRPAAFGSYQNLFLTSHTCNGQMRFAKLVSGVEAYPYAITCDTAGHLYVAFYGLHHTAPLRIGYDTTITETYTYARFSHSLIQMDTLTGYVLLGRIPCLHLQVVLVKIHLSQLTI